MVSMKNHGSCQSTDVYYIIYSLSFQVKEDQFSFPFKKIESGETKNLLDICSALKSGNYSRTNDVLLDLKQLFRVGKIKTERQT